MTFVSKLCLHYPLILPGHILATKVFYFRKERAQMTNFKWNMGRIEHRKG
jgi:hypothetical protein